MEHVTVVTPPPHLPPHSRARIPKTYGIIQLTLRSLALILDIVALIYLADIIQKLALHNSVYGSALASTSIAMVLNIVELLALGDKSHRMPRPHPSVALFFDLGIAAAGAAGAFILAFFAMPCCKYYYLSDEELARMNRRLNIAVGVVAAIACLHAVFVLWDVVDCCRVRRAKRRAVKLRRVQVVDPAYPPAEIIASGARTLSCGCTESTAGSD